MDRIRRHKRLVFGIGLSFGPFSTLDARTMTEQAIRHFDWLVVRDKASAEIAAGFATGRVVQAPDIALILHPEFVRLKGAAVQSQKATRIGFFIGPGFAAQDTEKITLLIDIMLATAANGGRIVAPTLFVSCADSASSDAELATLATSVLADRGISAPVHVYRPDTPRDFLRHLFQMDCIVSSRLHPAVVGMSVGLPNLQIDSGQPKLHDVLSSLGLEPVGFSMPAAIGICSFEALFAALEPGSKASAAIAANAERAAMAQLEVAAAMTEAFDALAAELVAAAPREIN